MIRLKDIAREAKVSRPVVSAVINGGHYTTKVSEAKTREILEIAKRLNYIPNISACLLKGKSSMTLGVLIDSEDCDIRFQQLRAIDAAAGRSGYRLLIAEAHNDPERHLLNYRTLLQYGVDAVICHANVFHDKLPLNGRIIFWGAAPVSEFPTAYSDIGLGYGQAMASFKAEGRKNIGLVVSDSRFDSVTARRREFMRLNPGKEKNIFTVARDDGHPELFRAVMASLLDNSLIPNSIDAVIMQNDAWALALLGQAASHKLRVPEDIAIVGHDSSFFGLCSGQSISTINPNLDGLGAAVIDLALKRIKNPDACIGSISVETWFEKRETSGKRLDRGIAKHVLIN